MNYILLKECVRLNRQLTFNEIKHYVVDETHDHDHFQPSLFICKSKVDYTRPIVLETHLRIYGINYSLSFFCGAETTFTFPLARQQQCLTYSHHFFLTL